MDQSYTPPFCMDGPISLGNQVTAKRTERLPTPKSPAQFMNRELSQLAFNRRVLALAEDRDTPTLERLRFLCMFSSNLDEFYEIRITGLKEQIKRYAAGVGRASVNAPMTLVQIAAGVHELVVHQCHLFKDILIPELARKEILFLRRPHWTVRQATWIRDYFFRELMPLLTPIGLDPTRPFPRVLNKSLNFAVELDGKDAFGRNSGTAIVLASALPQVIRLPAAIAGCKYGFVFLSSIMHAHVEDLFVGMHVRGCYQFRVTRSSELLVNKEQTRNLSITLQRALPQCHFGDAVRLEVAENCSLKMRVFLQHQFRLTEDDVFSANGPVNLARPLQMPN